MKNSKDNFEKAWKDVFDGAFVTPREDVWTKIDSQLSQQQVGQYKRKLLVYKLMAAASIVFAIGFGLFSIFENNGDLPMESQIITGEIPENYIQDSDIAEKLSEEHGFTETADFPESETELAEKLVTGNKSEPQIQAALSDQNRKETVSNQHQAEIAGINESGKKVNLGLMKNREIQVPRPATVSAPERKKSLFDEPWIEFIETEESEVADLWAGVNLSSGMFDPNISYGSRSSGLSNIIGFSDEAMDNAELASPAEFSMINANRASSPERNDYQPEISYAYGLNLGFQISPRFTLLGGLSYMYNNSSTKVNSYIENTTTNTRIAYEMLNADKIERSGINTYNSSSEEIKLNNSYQFLTVPVKIGYSLINKKVEWILLGGLSADFLLQNQIYDEEGYLNSVELSSGESSPYNSTYLNGSVGTMLNYTLSERYLFSLEPSYRLGLSYLTKEEAGFNSRPTSFFISAGVSYIFR